jgi:hypothetical protein
LESSHERADRASDEPEDDHLLPDSAERSKMALDVCLASDEAAEAAHR